MQIIHDLEIVVMIGISWIIILIITISHCWYFVTSNKIHKRTDTAVAFTQEYSRVSYPQGNVSTQSTGLGLSKDIHTGVGE